MSSEWEPLLGRLPGCARLPRVALSSLLAAVRVEELPPAARLVTEGEPAPDWYCIVASGAVQVSRVGPEADDILDYLADGDVLDAGPPGAPTVWSASVVEAARCLLISRAAVEAVTEARPQALVDPARTPQGELALFVGRIRDLVKGPPVTCPPTTPVADAARLMSHHGVGSVIVAADGGPLGIVTDRDLRTRVLAAGLPSSASVTAIMSSPLISVDVDAMAFDGLLEMTRRNIHHLGVEREGRLVGVVSSHDLLLLQGAHPVALAREIEAQGAVEGLVAVAPRVEAVVKWLVAGGAAAFDIGRIVAELNDRLVRRAVGLTEVALEQQRLERPAVAYSWLAAGSEGRREQTLKTDQDNGLVYEDPRPEETELAARYFGRLAAAVAATLVRLGFPLCDGGFMASNPKWCQPASVWRGQFAAWMDHPMPGSVLEASLFFDLRAVAGDPSPGAALWEWVCERAPSNTLFLRYMARDAVDRQPPLGFFGRFVVERTGAHKDQLDLKGRGVFPMTQAMRVYALSQGVRETNTVDRLTRLGGRGIFSPSEVAELRGAYEVIARLRLTHQLARLEAGQPPDNFIDPDALGKADRLLLKEAFRSLGWLQRELEGRFLTGVLG